MDRYGWEPGAYRWNNLSQMNSETPKTAILIYFKELYITFESYLEAFGEGLQQNNFKIVYSISKNQVNSFLFSFTFTLRHEF